MSRAVFCHVAWLTAWMMLSATPLLAQAPQILNPTLTINVARQELAGADPRNPGSVVSAVALSPDGRIVAAVGDDHVVRTYELASGRNLQALTGHARWVRGAAFALD